MGQTTPRAFIIQAIMEKTIAEQLALHAALLQDIGEASFDQMQKLLQQGNGLPKGKGISPERVARYAEWFPSEQQ